MRVIRLAVAADSEVHHASRRNFADHAAQLFHTFHLVAVEAENYVVLFDSGLAGGSVLIDQGDFDAVFFFQLQIGQAIRSDVTRVNTQIGSAAEVFAGVSEGLAEGLLRAKLPAAGDRCKHRQNQSLRGSIYACSFLLFQALHPSV